MRFQSGTSLTIARHVTTIVFSRVVVYQPSWRASGNIVLFRFQFLFLVEIVLELIVSPC